jgi:hypothetical protein
MSESVFKFYPLEPTRGFLPGESDAIISAFRDANDSSIAPDTIQLHDHTGIQFIDCGSALERIKCPLCGDSIPNGQWQSAMNADFHTSTGFALTTTVPCSCGREIPLHGLRYDAHCGFSRSWVSVVVHSHFWLGWLLQYPWIGHVEAQV